MVLSVCLISIILDSIVKFSERKNVGKHDTTIILLYIKQNDIFIYRYIGYHFTDTMASTLTRRSEKTVKYINLKLFVPGQMP